MNDSSFWVLYRQLKRGEVSRREFIDRASKLGVSMPVILFVLNAVRAGAERCDETVQDATEGAQ